MSDSSDPSLYFDTAPEDIITYVYEMLRALANLADREGEVDLALQIRMVSEHRGARRGLAN